MRMTERPWMMNDADSEYILNYPKRSNEYSRFKTFLLSIEWYEEKEIVTFVPCHLSEMPLDGLATNWKKEPSKWQLTNLFVIEINQIHEADNENKFSFHVSVFAVEWPSMGNSLGNANYPVICCQLYGWSRKSIDVQLKLDPRTLPLKVAGFSSCQYEKKRENREGKEENDFFANGARTDPFFARPLEISSNFTTGTNRLTAKRFADLSFNFARIVFRFHPIPTSRELQCTLSIGKGCKSLIGPWANFYRVAVTGILRRNGNRQKGNSAVLFRLRGRRANFLVALIVFGAHLSISSPSVRKTV